MPKPVYGFLVTIGTMVPLSSNCANGKLKVGTTGRTLNAPSVRTDDPCMKQVHMHVLDPFKKEFKVHSNCNNHIQ